MSARPGRRAGATGPAAPARRGAEQVQGADDLVPQPHRQRLDRAEPGLRRRGGEPRPRLARPGEVSGGDRPAGAAAVQARPWSFWTWNGSISPADWLDAAATRSSPRGSASRAPAADAPSSTTLRSASMYRKSTPSKSATSVSARSPGPRYRRHAVQHRPSSRPRPPRPPAGTRTPPRPAGLPAARTRATGRPGHRPGRARPRPVRRGTVPAAPG